MGVICEAKDENSKKKALDEKITLNDSDLIKDNELLIREKTNSTKPESKKIVS